MYNLCLNRGKAKNKKIFYSVYVGVEVGRKKKSEYLFGVGTRSNLGGDLNIFSRKSEIEQEKKITYFKLLQV